MSNNVSQYSDYILTLSDEQKINVENCYILGRLAREPEEIEYNVTYRKNNYDIIFYLKILSRLPEEIKDEFSKIEKYSVGYPIYPVGIFNYAFSIPLKNKYFDNNMEFKYKKDNDKIEYIKKLLSNKIIIFKPYLKNNNFFNLIIHDLIEIKDIDINKEYVPVPIIDTAFEEKLLKHTKIPLNEYKKSMGKIKCILFDNKIYYSEKWNITEDGIVAQNVNEMKYLELTEIQQKDFIKVLNEKLSFVEQEILNNIIYEIEKSGEYVQEDNEVIRTKKMAKDKGFTYKESDIFNFHISLNTGNLVILCGMSGVGKSKLVELYAKALNLEEALDKNKEELGDSGSGLYKIIPVKSSWTDDTDLIGYLDTINNLYRPADNGLIKILIEASNHLDRRYIICLDEMNLARVEFYFSQFLSVLEMENRYLQLYSAAEKVYNATEFPSRIKIGHNVSFVGTVNIDESTFRFSDKVLDRANIIRLEANDFVDWYSELLKDEYEIEINEGEFTLSLVIDFLQNLNQEIQKIDSQKGFGYRVVNQIIEYLKQVKIFKGKYIKINEAFEIQIIQKILPKIRGTKDVIGKLVGEYDGENLTNSIIFDNICKNYPELGAFINVKNELIRKAKELKYYEYTM